jgi:SsrA-binding protein
MSQHTKKITNRRASFDYFLEDEFLAGIILNGREVKNLRLGHGDLTGAYVTIKNQELWLINCMISGVNGIPISEDEKTQPRKLLVKKNEFKKILQHKEQGKTIIPLEILIKYRYIKIKIAVGKGKKHYDKRQSLKQKEQKRIINQNLKQKFKN